MVGQITNALAKHNPNIPNLLNKSRGDIAYTLVEVDSAIPRKVAFEIATIEGVLATRVIADR